MSLTYFNNFISLTFPCYIFIKEYPYKIHFITILLKSNIIL